MVRCLMFFCLLVFLQCTTFAQDRHFLNPGFKFGHTFGQEGGFTLGFEMSYTKFSSNTNYGIFFAIDYCRNANRFKYLVGAEYLVLAIGPSVIVEENEPDFGFNFTPYFGFVVIPYYSYTFRFTRGDLHELGSFLKFPILVKGKDFNLGG